MKRRRLGQHFLLSHQIAKKIVDAANITKKDTVLEIGTGRGILIPYLCQKAGTVISAEADKELYMQAASKFSSYPNLKLIYGDGFCVDAEFDIFVSNLPYSKSRHAIQWLAQKKFKRAVIMVQAEFADKLLSKSQKKAISVIAKYAFEIQKIISVNKNNFEPPPKINSVVLVLHSKKQPSHDLIDATNKLFSYRRKTISNIMEKFGVKITSQKRLDDLNEEEIISLAKQII